ncbi:hypothetical protein NSK_006078 [Nannochloropsis salina CCMP1776]|uniref:START domain-containing protein n=1 Tax=Nannochloropsis salina CCMP1776 TaxID=1027361 RepID=A0A4D9CVN7_9STRA|nr:hypothetical protein NSK_006078 [Nannochloropsis salina CCMP1776]|eukprot:TFJ82654.1 hypothetical protein NSK_006078 [Nannochloropsis salina CCMP1776]
MSFYSDVARHSMSSETSLHGLHFFSSVAQTTAPLGQVLRRATLVLAVAACASLLVLTHGDVQEVGKLPLITLLGLAGASFTEEPASVGASRADSLSAVVGRTSVGVQISPSSPQTQAKSRGRGSRKATEGEDEGEGEWVEHRSADGRVNTAFRREPWKPGTISLRGQASVDHHIAEVLTVFLNTSLSTEWVSYLDHAEELPTGQENAHIIYQFFDMPLPLSDREFLMRRTVVSDRRKGTVWAHYASVEHASKPRRRSVVRGETCKTLWTFLAKGKDQTVIQVESSLNPKLPVNGWLVQMMQNTYQRASLLAMLDLIKRAKPHPSFVHW